MKKMLWMAAIAAIGLLGSVSEAQRAPTAGMMRHPDVSQNKIVFSYADDLWIVNRNGGEAKPLTSPKGTERFAKFSPDGNSIAFVANYDGGSEIYSIPVLGGVAERWTYHPAREQICDWTPDGKSIIFSSNGEAGLGRQQQLFTVSSEAPLPTRLPVPYGTNGSISSDGEWLAYTPHSRDTRTWKRYRGGMASDVWLFHLKDKSAKQITDFEGTDSFPMWFGKSVYYLSDAGPEHRLNIWEINVETGKRQQITTFKDFDCKWPSMGPGVGGQGEIILSNGSNLHLVDLGTRRTSAVNVTVGGDRPKIRSRKVDVAEFIEAVGISSTGKRVVVEARGDLWTAPVKNGSPRNLTATDGIAERDPAWSPDGRWISYFSDQTGEYELYVTQSDGRGETKQLTKDGNCFRYNNSWSPDSKHILFSDKTGKIFLHTIASGETKLIDTDPFAGRPSVTWSHDSAWIAYDRAGDQRSPSNSIWLYEVASGEKSQITSDFFNDANPAFDAKGDFLFFSSNRAFNSPKYEDVGSTFIYSGTEVIMAMPLRRDVKYPMAPKVDEETWKDEKSEDKSDSDSKAEDSNKDDSPKDKSKDAEKKDGG